jgi:hypothetical protein
MTSKTQTEQYLRGVELPEQTKSYTVISHGDIIDRLRNLLQENNFVIETELYKGESKGEIALGFIKIKNDLDPDMGMTFNWSNSYNKQLRFSCSIGGFIYDNKVPFVSSTDAAIWARKHTGIALDETLETMEAMISSANDHFNEIVEMKKRFQSFKVSRKDYAKLVGLLYFDKKIISIEQASIIRKEYDNPSFDYSDLDNLWGLYKIIMHAVADQSPKTWYQQQVKINNYVQLMYKMVKADDELEELVIEDDEQESEQTRIDLSDIEGEYTLDEMPSVIATIENKIVEGSGMSEEQIEMVEREYAYPLEKEEQPVASFFDSIEKKNPVTPSESFVKGTIEEREEAMCDNCGSTDVIINASAQICCNNCGHEEDTGLNEDVIEEDEEVIFEEEEEIISETFSEDDELTLFDDEELILPTVEEIVPKVEEVVEEKELKIDDLFSLDDEEETVEVEAKVINPRIKEFIEKFYAIDSEHSNIVETDNYTVVEMNTNEMFVL